MDEKEQTRSAEGEWYLEERKGDRIGGSWRGMEGEGRSAGSEAGAGNAHCLNSMVGSLMMESMWRNETVDLVSERCMEVHPSS